VVAAHPERVEEPILADSPCHSERSERVPADAGAVFEEGIEKQIPRRFAPRDDKQGSAPRDDQRYTVYTAKYRLVLKGPDRGKWECSVTAEADAPLVTVETVVRGVQRRSGEEEEPERMSGDDARDYVLAATR
jgi:hypothetical protein